MLKAIVFDYGRVLSLSPTHVDWERLAAVFEVSVDQFQKPYWALRDRYDRATFTSESYWRGVASALGKNIDEEDIARLVVLDNTQWMRENPEMLEFAWQAQNAGMKIGILSNMQTDMFKAMRQKLKWLWRFDAQVYTCEIGVIKPEPESYHAILHELDVPARESLFFDDKQPNIDGARAVGMHAAVFAGDMATVYEATAELGLALEMRKAVDGTHSRKTAS